MSSVHARAWEAAAGVLAGMVLLGATAVPLFAQTQDGESSREQMHQMMESMRGSGASERMQEMVGADMGQMMEQCRSMMEMMQNMMGDGGMSGSDMRGMMGGSGMSMSEPGGGSTSDMMRRMMGR